MTTQEKRPGRPRNSDPPRFPADEVERILVFGETVGVSTIQYPSFRELAERYDVTHNAISQFADRKNCLQRREQFQNQVRKAVEEKLVEQRIGKCVVTAEQAVELIDEYVLEFWKALKENRVRCDNPSDLNALLRLKQFMLGGADSRQEVNSALLLESLQARHREILEARAEESLAQRGEVELPDNPRARPIGQRVGKHTTDDNEEDGYAGVATNE